jgi:serine/threonine-protein kinase RsbW
LGKVSEGHVKKAKILVIDHEAASRASLKRMLTDREHRVVAVADGRRALEKIEHEDFDLIISDLATHNSGDFDGLQLIAQISKKAHAPVVVSASTAEANIHKAFKVGAANYLQQPYDKNSLERIVEKTLSYKLRQEQSAPLLPHVRETIEIEMPSDVRYLDGVLSYLVERAARFGIVAPGASNIFVALDEALANAIRHGNKNDPSKCVRVRANISTREARFTISDEGAGFDIAAVPDPCDPANLLKPSGRGVMLIHHIMDDVSYNERGNEVTMVKRPEEKKKDEVME